MTSCDFCFIQNMQPGDSATSMSPSVHALFLDLAMMTKKKILKSSRMGVPADALE
jgi:hypothetical protein